MPSHPRDSIVQAIVTLLIAANTAAGSRVDSNRLDPRKKTQIPAISVYALSDQTNTSASSEMEEAHDLLVEVAAAADPTALNALMLQVETAIRADPYFSANASDSTIARTPIDLRAVDGRSDPIVAFATLNVLVRYHVALAAT
jgi:hypothetical protein